MRCLRILWLLVLLGAGDVQHNNTAGSWTLVNLYVGIVLDAPLDSGHGRSSTSAIDYSAVNSTCTLNNTTLGADSTDFNGSNAYVDCGHGFGFCSPTGAFTISYWANMDDATSFRAISKDNLTTTREWFFVTNPSDKLFCAGMNSVGSLSTGTLTPLEGSWAHFVCSYDGVNPPDLYINGTLIASSSTSSGTGGVCTVQPIEIGKIGSSYADGEISDIKVISGYGWSSQQVTMDYERGRSGGRLIYTP